MQEALLHRTATQHPSLPPSTIHHPPSFIINHPLSTIIHHSLITDHHCILHSLTTATPTKHSPPVQHHLRSIKRPLYFHDSFFYHQSYTTDEYCPLSLAPYKHIYTSTHIVLLIRSKLSNSRFMLFPMHLSDTRHQKIDSPSSPFTDVFLL
jgi:hypothetical protein